MTKPDTAVRTKAAALHAVIAAAHDADAAKSEGTAAVAQAQQRLHLAVDAARDVGALWGEIGDVLGIRRGNAYQLYRRRPPQSPRRAYQR